MRKPEAAVPALVARVRQDLADVIGVRGAPSRAHVSQLADRMPLDTAGELDRVAAASARLASFVDLNLAGTPYRGVGMPDCIGHGRGSAATVLARLAGIREAREGMTEGHAGVDRPSPVGAVPAPT